jgi:signal transduction histidine kinase/DNA-binding response OmpR family regulator
MNRCDALLSNARVLFLAVLAGIVCAAGIGYVAVERSADDVVRTASEQAALSWASYVGGSLPRIAAIARGEGMTADERSFLDIMRRFGDVFLFKLFDPQGRLVLVSDDLQQSVTPAGDIREHNPTALAVLESGLAFSQLKDGTAKPDRPDVYVEIYVPVKSAGETVAIVEVYVDQTVSAAEFRQQFLLFGIKIGGLILAAISLPLLALARVARTLRARNAEIAVERDRAQASERAKAEFLANMSHEIRTPLNGVLGMTGLILETRLNDEQRQYAETILGSGEALLNLLNDILDFSKIEAGKLELEASNFAIVDLVDSSVELFAQQAHSKGLELPAFVDSNIPETLYGDEGRIRQVLLNLISNAIKFTEVGGVAVEVSATLHDAADGQRELRFEVADTGLGIPEDMLDNIFEQFTQVDGTSTRKHGGTGLGLAICKRLVELMGGAIGVEQRDSGGSLFWFNIPLTPGGRTAFWGHDVALSIGDRRILVVDDNVVNRLVFERQLMALGARVQVAIHAASALRKIATANEEGERYDFIIIDHMMPGTDGLDLGRQIRDMPGMGDAKLVLSSSSGLFNSHVAARRHGFDAALPKPVRPGALIRCIEEISRPAGTGAIAEIPRLLTQAAATAAHVRILVGEDNPTNQRLIVALLKSRNYKVDTAANGLEVIEALRNVPYDLVLMDVQMPELDGIEACRRIRAMPTDYASIPIVGVTAHAMKGDRERVLGVGMNDYVSKPIRRDELFAIIGRLLPDKPAAGDADARALQARLRKSGPAD